MKQSTKLLSFVIAIVMAFSCLSVIGNAALVKSEVKYDNIDDADLTPEQVADLALDNFSFYSPFHSHTICMTEVFL